MKVDPGTLEDIRHVLQIIRLLMFAIFVVLGFRVFRAYGARRRRVVNQFIIYTFLAHLVILIPQNEAWPFSMYPMMATNADAVRDEFHSGVYFGLVDENGKEWRVDWLAWSPLFPQSVMGWFEVSWPRASAQARHEVLRFLLVRAENARIHRQNGDLFFGNARLLGPLTAPDTNLWGHAPQSAARYRTLRVYRLSWVPTLFWRERKIVSRALMGEYSE